MMDSKPPLYVEVLIESLPTFVRTDQVCKDVEEWLKCNFVHLKIGENISDFKSLGCSSSIKSIQATEFDGPNSEAEFYRIGEVSLHVCSYILQESSEVPGTQLSIPHARNDESSDPSEALRIISLPNKDLVGLWEGLVFDCGTPKELLRYASGMMDILSSAHLDTTKVNWNKLMLLHGPPGSGKTSLCRALAQKITIRMSHRFEGGKLIEMNTHALLSKWFGESGKLVSKAFDEIISIANGEDEANLICVLIDEVETLTAVRGSRGEVGDALRATNQVLTAIDKLRSRSNVLVFCTSNLLNVIDPAFLDRADIIRKVPNPTAAAAYEILRSTMNELLRCGIILGHRQEAVNDSSDQNTTPFDEASAPGGDPDPNCPHLFAFPPLAETRIRFHDEPDSPPQKLWIVAKCCEGMSGRTLRRLPLKAVTMYAYTRPCSLNDAMQALSFAANEVLGGA